MRSLSWLVAGSAAAAMVFTLVTHRSPWLMADETMYARGAWNLAHRGLVLPDIPGAMNYPPLYSVLLAPASLVPGAEARYWVSQVINLALWLGGTGCVAAAATSVPRWLVWALALTVPAGAAYVPLIMSENLALFLLHLTAFSLSRGVQNPTWLATGWVLALLAPFCRIAGLVVPLAFVVAVGPRRLWGVSRARVVILASTAAAAILLLMLPTTGLRVYHPWSTFTTTVRSLASLAGWGTLLRHCFTALSLLTVASGGLVWLLAARQEGNPLARFLRGVVLGHLVLTIAYMQYQSQGPHPEASRALMRYMDPSVALAVPWALVTLRGPWSRSLAVPALVAAVLAAVLWPQGSFKQGQVLSLAGLGFGSVPFYSWLSALPVRIAAGVVALVAVPLLLSRGIWKHLSLALAVGVFAVLAHDSLSHSVAMSQRQQMLYPGLKRLSQVAPRSGVAVVDEREATPELLNGLLLGAFWTPWMRVLPGADIENLPELGAVVLVSGRWQPYRILSQGWHVWYRMEEAPPPVEYSRYFYDVGPASSLWDAPPPDGESARWTGEHAVLEIRLFPLQGSLVLGLNPGPWFARAEATVLFNGHILGSFTSEEQLVSFPIPPSAWKDSGRQLLQLRTRPLDWDTPDLWRNGIRLDWVAVVPSGQH